MYRLGIGFASLYFMHGICEGTSQVMWLSFETVRLPAPVINVSVTLKLY